MPYLLPERGDRSLASVQPDDCRLSQCSRVHPERSYARVVGDLDFLIGKTVAEIRDDNRIVFVRGSRPEPDLYVDVGEPEVVDGAGLAQSIDALVGRTVAAASGDGGMLRLAFDDDSLLSVRSGSSIRGVASCRRRPADSGCAPTGR